MDRVNEFMGNNVVSRDHSRYVTFFPASTGSYWQEKTNNVGESGTGIMGTQSIVLVSISYPCAHGGNVRLATIRKRNKCNDLQ